jgi:hypothetical protein
MVATPCAPIAVARGRSLDALAVRLGARERRRQPRMKQRASRLSAMIDVVEMPMAWDFLAVPASLPLSLTCVKVGLRDANAL